MKHLVNVVGVLVLAGAFYLLMNFAEVYVLNSGRVIPREDITIEEWIDEFRQWASLVIGAGTVTSLLWYGLGQWGFGVNDWRASNRRPVWLLLALVPAGAAILSMVVTRQPQEGWFYAPAFYLLNGLLCYYLQTALFSPSSFKYTPLGASRLRVWNLPRWAR